MPKGPSGPAKEPEASCREKLRGRGRVADRTANRHRWARREASGARVSLGQGTRQTVPVTSGEGEPPVGEALRAWSRKGSQRIGPDDCLLKTQVSAKSWRRRIGTDACPVPEG